MVNISRLIVLLFLFPTNLLCQSIIDEISDEDIDSSVVKSLDLPTETIEKVSASKTIYIISNNNSSFGKGDFISLVINNDLVNRAVVAKVTDTSAGIKIVKTYNAQYAQSIRPGSKVKVIRGDDSYFANLKAKANNKEEDDSLIDDEDDLFNDTALLSDNVETEENTKRLIRTDHLLFGGYALLSSINASSEPTTLSQVGMNYSYQVEDNIWGEIFITQSDQTKFPSDSITTTLTNLTLRAKYTVKLPSYSYLMPYIGLQKILASPSTTELTTAENTVVESAEETNIAFGVTLLKRLVPGWFIRADLGTDIYSIGLGIEF